MNVDTRRRPTVSFPSSPRITRISTTLFIAFTAALLLQGVNVHAQCLQNVNMSTWSRQGNPNLGQWTVVAGGSAVIQYKNDDPTFFVAPFDLINVEITGTISVAANQGDDDYIGFVFGYKDPLSTNFNDYDFWLLDWKQREQSSYKVPTGLVGREGFYLSRVSGTIPPNQVFRYFWNHETTPNLFEPVDSLLAIYSAAGAGWQNGVTYQFQLTYTSVRIEVRINNQVIFQRNGCFQPGRFGFYNFSQPGVTYSNFNYRLLADYTTSDSSVCIGETINFSAVNTNCSTVPTNITSWQWTFGDGSTSTAVNPSHSYNQSGTYPVTLTITDNNNCVDSVTRSVTVFAGPTVDAGQDVGICPGSSTIIGNNATGSPPPYTYSWTPITGLSSPSSAQTEASPASTTTYTLSVTDGNGCTNTDDVTVIVYPTPTARAGQDIALCLGSSVTIGLPANGGSGPYTYQWSPANGLDDPAIAQPTANPSTTTTYTVTVTDANGCTDEDEITVTVNDNPVADAGPDVDLCRGASIGIGGIATGGAGGYSYLWLPSDGLSANNVSQPTASPLRTTLYRQVVTDANGCTDTAVVTVTVLDVRPPAIDGPLSVCPNSVWTYSSNMGALVTHTWSIDPPTAGAITSGQGTPSIELTWGNPGRAELTLDIDSAGCTATATVRVDINDRILVSINDRGDRDTLGYCLGKALTLDAGDGFVSYLWSPGGEQTRTIQVQTPGTYAVTVRDAYGCEGQDTVQVIEYPNPVPVIDPVGPVFLCQGDTLVLSLSEPYASYQWSTGEKTDQIRVTSTGVYGVTVIDDKGCEGTAPPVTVTMVSRPIPFVSGDTIACIGSVEEYYFSIPSGSPYTWSIDESMGTVTETGTLTIKVRWTAMGRAFVAVAETDPTTQCVGVDTLWVEVTEGLMPGIIGDTLICADGTARLSAIGGPFETHEWLRDGVPIAGETDSTLLAVIPGSYTVRVSAGDCSGESAPHLLTVIPLPKPSIQPAGPITLCPGDSVRLSVAGDYRSLLWSTGETSAAITVRLPGLYTVTADSLGCSGTSEEREVRFVAFPDTVISGPSTACLNSRNSYEVPDNPAFTFSWTVTGGSLVSGAGTARVTVEWTDSTGGLLTLVMTHRASGCAVTLMLPVVIDRTLRPEIAFSGAPVICQGGALVLRAGKGFLAYRWYRNGTAIANEDSDTLRVTRAGSYVVEVTDNGGCSGVSTPVDVTVSDPPTPAITADGPTTICRGDSVVLRTQNSYASYRWSTGATTPSITVFSSGSYTVEVRNASGCTATSAPLTVVARPVTPPVISGPVSLCRSNTEAQEYSVIVETGMSYTWDAVGATSITPIGANRVAIVWGNVDMGQVLVTKTEDAVGCVAYDTLIVIIGDSLSPVITADGQPPALGTVRLCAGERTTLGVQGMYRSYEWSTGATTPTITVDLPGTYTVLVSDTTGCRGTSGPLIVTVAPAPLPVIAADGPLQFCRGDSVTLSTTDAFASYLWSTGAATRAIVVRDGGTFTVTVTSADGCEGTSAPVTVTVTPPASHKVEGPSSVCLGEEATYRDAVSDPNMTYSWIVTGPVGGPGTIVSGQGSSEIRVRWPSAGQGTVRMDIDDSQSGCSGSATLLVSVGSGLTPVITASADPLLCVGESLELCTEPGDSYVWSPGGETTRCITVTTPGSYSVTVTRGSCNGSSGPFVVDPAPTPIQPVITASLERLCLGGSTVLDAGPGYASYAWLLDGQPTGDTLRQVTFTPVRGGSYRFSVVVRNRDGCASASEVRTIEVFPPVTPVLSETGTEVVCDPSGTTYGYQWYINDTLVTGADADRIPIARTGVYVVQITDENGCSAWSDPLPVLARIPSTVVGFGCPPQRPYRVGETVFLPLVMESSENLDGSIAREIALRLRFNPSVLDLDMEPVDTRMENGERIITLTADRPGTSTVGTLLEIPVTVLFGNADCATVRIDSMWWTDGSARVTTTDTDCEICVEVCREGGTRLFYAEGALGLAQNRPNPFNSSTVIEYEVIERGPTSLFVLDVVGRRVATLLHETLEPGRYVTTFDAADLKSGTYICVLQTPSHSVHTLMMLVK